MRTIDEVKAEIEELEKEIDQFELDPEDYTEMFDDYLNENGDVEILGLTYDPAYILKNVDPIAYRELLLNFVDDQDKSGDSDYTDLIEELESLQDELADLEDEE